MIVHIVDSTHLKEFGKLKGKLPLLLFSLIIIPFKPKGPKQSKLCSVSNKQFFSTNFHLI